MNERFFSEYRYGDYRTARSMKELYGWEPTLYVEEDVDSSPLLAGLVLALLFGAYALAIWVM